MNIKISTIAKATSLLFTVVAFILLLTTHSCYCSASLINVYFTGTDVIFGCQATTDPVAVALIAWILTIIAILVLSAVLLADLVQIDAITAFDLYIAIGTSALLIAIGILILCTPGAVGEYFSLSFNLDGGWIVAVILVFSSSIANIAPIVLDYLGIKL